MARARIRYSVKSFYLTKYVCQRPHALMHCFDFLISALVRVIFFIYLDVYARLHRLLFSEKNLNDVDLDLGFFYWIKQPFDINT